MQQHKFQTNNQPDAVRRSASMLIVSHQLVVKRSASMLIASHQLVVKRSALSIPSQL